MGSHSIIKIENLEQLKKVLLDEKIRFEELADFLENKIIFDKKFNVEKEFEAIHPHNLLKPTQAGLDLKAICIELGDNAVDVGCTELLYQFNVAKDDSLTVIVKDNGPGIINHDIKNAVAYGGYLGPKDITKSGKFLEGLSNACGCFADYIEIYTNNGYGWYKSAVRFDRLKSMIKTFENEFVTIRDELKNLYRGLVYKFIAETYIDDPIKIEEDANEFLDNEKGTTIIFKKCNIDVIDTDRLDSDLIKLKESLGRRYWNKIDKGLNITVAKNEISEKVLSIDIMLRSANCNFRKAYNTTFFVLEKMFKVSDFTLNPEDNEYIPLNVSIKEKTGKYAIKKPKRIKDTDFDKVIVPEILVYSLENQLLSIERSNLPIIDYASCGLTKHNSTNGISFELCVDNRMDEALFITGDKSGLSDAKLTRLLRDKLKPILDQAKQIKNNGGAFSYINADGQKNEVLPTVIIGEDKLSKESILDNKEAEELNLSKSNETIKPEKSPNVVKESEIKNSEIHPIEEMNIEYETENKDDKWISGLVFAANYKSNCRYDADKNTMVYERNDSQYLIYDQVIDSKEGLRIKHLQNWWLNTGIADMTLEERMRSSIPQKASSQKRVFNIYKNKIEILLKENTPALLVETELYHNSYIFNSGGKNTAPQRFDFCMILPGNKKIILEIDGIHHIANKSPNGHWIADEQKYASQCKFDAEWTLKGNEIYRVSNGLLSSLEVNEGNKYIEKLFISILKKHKILV